MLVSIGIPTYNRSGYLARAIQSVLAQTYLDYEIIVSDDCSSDDTETVVRNFANPRIRYVKSRDRLGVQRNWNTCVRLATGDLFALLPDDDEYAPQFLETMVAALASNPDIAFVQCTMRRLDRLSVPGETFVIGNAPTTMHGVEALRWQLSTFKCNPVAILFRRPTMLDMGLWREDYWDDWAFIFKLAYRHGFLYIPNILAYNRDHPDNLSKQLAKARRDGTLDFINQLSDVFGVALPVTPELLGLRVSTEHRISRACIRGAIKKWRRAEWRDGMMLLRRAHQLFPLALFDPRMILDISDRMCSLIRS